MGKLSLQQDVMLAAIALIKKQTRLIVRNEPELIRKFVYFTYAAQ